MCGNDGLQARSNFAGQSGTCNYGPLNTALNNCTTYLQQAMQFMNANAYSGTKVKIVANLYYPGYNADNALSGCNDPTTGQKVNKQTSPVSTRGSPLSHRPARSRSSEASSFPTTSSCPRATCATTRPRTTADACRPS